MAMENSTQRLQRWSSANLRKAGLIAVVLMVSGALLALVLAAETRPAPPKSPSVSPEDTARKMAELQDLGMDDDAASLHKILRELTNGVSEVRRAAVDATLQFGSRDAIPALKAAAANTTNATERATFQEAIEFLKLPSLTELMSTNAGTGHVARPMPRTTAGRPALNLAPRAKTQ